MRSRLQSLSRPSSQLKWTLYAGGYVLFITAILTVVLRPVVETVVNVLPVPTESVELVLIGPTTLIGAFVWWLVVERQTTYTYFRGSAVGVITAGLMVLVWMGLAAFVYGPRAVVAGGLLIGFVSIVVLPVGGVAAVPLMYARRRYSGH